MELNPEVVEKHQQRLRGAIAKARHEQEGDDVDEDEEGDEPDEDEEDEDEELEAALATITKRPEGIARLKHLLGIKEDKFAVTPCQCPECIYEGVPGTKTYRAVRQFHWFCYVCGGGPYVWQLTQPPYIKPISRNGVVGEAHYCCGSACQSRYESRYGLKKNPEYVAEGTYISERSGVVAR